MFQEETLRVGEERRLIRIVASPFVAHEEAVGKSVVEGDGIFFERLRDAAEQSAAIGKIFGARGDSDARRELILKIGGAPGDV